MRTINLISLLLIFAVIFQSCKQDNAVENNDSNNDTVVEISIPEVKTGNFYKTDIKEGNAIVIADTITYDVEIKNNNVEDTWKEECLKHVNRKALTNIIFNAVYNKRLTAYNYRSGESMTIEEVKTMEKEYSRDRISKMQFIEEWFFNEEDLVFGKKVIGIMLAYEVYDYEGAVRGHSAGIVVYLNKKAEL